MKRLVSFILTDLFMMAAVTSASACVTQPSITPNTRDSQSIAATLSAYLAAFDVGDLRKAYSMFADIKQHMTLKQWEAQGDPQKGWRPVLTRVHVIERENAAAVYTVSTILPPTETNRHNLVFIFSMIKQNKVWKLVSDEAGFGHHTSLIFAQLSKSIETYAEKQHVPLN